MGHQAAQPGAVEMRWIGSRGIIVVVSVVWLDVERGGEGAINDASLIGIAPRTGADRGA
jgi:hypothetical protein